MTDKEYEVARVQRGYMILFHVLFGHCLPVPRQGVLEDGCVRSGSGTDADAAR